jgi:hypothetical protein
MLGGKYVAGGERKKKNMNERGRKRIIMTSKKLHV